VISCFSVTDVQPSGVLQMHHQPAQLAGMIKQNSISAK